MVKSHVRLELDTFSGDYDVQFAWSFHPGC